MDSAECVCVNSALARMVYLPRAQRLDTTLASTISWFRSTDWVISSPMLLPAAVQGVTPYSQIFTQTPQGSPVLNLSAAEMRSVHTHMLYNEFGLLVLYIREQTTDDS